jgi:hypothetical protein
MQKEMDVETFGDPDDDDEESIYYEGIGKCPLCHLGLHSDIMSARLYDSVLYTIEHCPSCDGVFFCSYKESDGNVYVLNQVMPQKFAADNLPDSIKKISPDFSNIFSQAQTAEGSGLVDICGLGYRRSLEFLIKDYLCSLDPPHTDEIRKQPLSQCIRDRMQDRRIKTLAERATWIGNDETHYIKKHEGLDVQDMKRFIRAMIAFIDAEAAFEEALKITPKK